MHLLTIVRPSGTHKFTSASNIMDPDKYMAAFIEEEMQKRTGVLAKDDNVLPKHTEDHLYSIPDHLKVLKSRI